MKKRIVFFAILTAVALLLWAPWMSRQAAEQRAEAAFASAWQGVADGCGFNCQGCGAVEAHRTAGGWQVTLEYACGLLPEDAPQHHVREKGFVSGLGIVLGYSQHEIDRETR